MTRTRCRRTSVTVATAACLLLSADARADESPSLSLSIERVAGMAYGSARPTSSDTSFSATTFGITGPAINPIALPRVGADALLPIGLTLGGALGYGYASLTVSPDGQTSQSITGNAWLISPRVGYLLHLGPLLDLWPRVGVTFAGAGLKEPDSQSCSSFANNIGPTSTTCTTSPGASDSLFFVAASLDVAAALRLTRSFNLLGGVAYDHVFAASGSASSSQSSGNSSSADLHAQGKYLGAQVWFGLGGYLL
jgi:hypothetical protein